LLTIHTSKGLEFKHVFLPFWNQGIIPQIEYGPEAMTQDLYEEERRIAYIGITRARKSLWISNNDYKYDTSEFFYES
jgi:DNA helicase-2/ATP-dependent DNA helicase PcrA